MTMGYGRLTSGRYTVRSRGERIQGVRVDRGRHEQHA